MDLSYLANIGELLGGIGVIASLLYLAKQIRSGTRAAHSTAYEEAVRQILDGVHEILGDRWNELNARSSDELNEVEQFQLEAPVAAFLFGSEALLHLKQQGHIDPRIMENVEKNFFPLLKTEFIYSALQKRPGPLSRDLLVEVDKAEIY
ncbi:MAG: hypothetical protein ACU84Q_21065 [Gammaproteobacteria bacterium]